MKKQIFVGGSLKDAATRIGDAWHHAERDEDIAAEDNLTFLSWSLLSASLTDKRYELLRRLHASGVQHPGAGARSGT